MLWTARIVTLATAILFPVAWLAPLARASVLPFFSGSEITILGGLMDLSQTDILLAIVVGVFAILIPYAKTLALLAAQFGLLSQGERVTRLVFALGKLSMTDVFLIALYIVIAKGVGIGSVTVAWGLYLFTALVLLSILASWLTLRALREGQ